MPATDQTKANFESFKKYLRHYAGLWKSVRIFAAAGSVEGIWNLLASRIALSELSADPAKHQIFRPTDDVVAFVKEIPYELFLQMLVTLVHEDYLADRYIQPSKDNEIFDIYLNFESMSWDRPWIADRPGIGEWVFQRRSIMFFRNGGPFIQKVNPEILNAADRKIGLKYPSYRNLADLFSNFMPGLGYAYSPNRVIQMVCVGTSSGSAKAAVLPCISRGPIPPSRAGSAGG